MKHRWMRALMSLTLAGLLAAGLSGCDEGGNPPVEEEPQPVLDYPVTVGDVSLDSPPLRAVVLSPSLAEIVADLGYADRLCGRSEECDCPSQVAALPSVGKPMMPDGGGVAALDADLVLTQAPLPEETTSFLEREGIPVAVIPAAASYEELSELYAQVGQLFAGTETGARAGEALWQTLDARMDEAAARLAGEEAPASLVYAVDSTGRVATGDTFIGSVMARAGLSNAAAAGTGWTLPESADAAYVFCPVEEVETVRGLSAFHQLSAIAEGQVYGIPVDCMERQGLRLAEGIEAILQVLVPQAEETTAGETENTAAP